MFFDRTGTWSGGGGGGVLGQGYASPGVPRKLMNSFGTLTHGSSGGLAMGGNETAGTGNGTLAGSGSSGTLKRPTLSTLTKGGSGMVKSPRPNKARVAVEALTQGLQGCIRSAEEEITHLKSSISDLSIHSNQVILVFIFSSSLPHPDPQYFSRKC